MKHKARLGISRMQCSSGKKIIRIEVEDNDAGIEFLVLEIGLEEFSEAITGLHGVECEMEVRGLDNVGKVKERSEIEFEIPQAEYGDRDKIASEYADKAAPEGWVASHYFGSKSSFFTVDGKQYARTSIARWVEKTEDIHND